FQSEIFLRKISDWKGNVMLFNNFPHTKYVAMILYFLLTPTVLIDCFFAKNLSVMRASLLALVFPTSKDVCRTYYLDI
ncbi:MAG: hypothetical protein M0Q94_09615, partial [Candidatus Cloacimonetes bacterium]|nr:hypothetical protein [Candidatus Cloacimonadota bacterium]